MAKKSRRRAPADRIAQAATLAAVVTALKRAKGLSGTRVRDLVSAVKRVAALLGDEPGAITVDVSALSAGLAIVNPVAIGITTKRLANLRSDFLAALKASGLIPASAFRKSALIPAWRELFQSHAGRRVEIGLSRLARYASSRGLAPKDINDDRIAEFIKAVREESLCARPKGLHRQVALIWNEVAGKSPFGLQCLSVPSFRTSKRIDWNLLPEALQQEVKNYLSWCSGPPAAPPCPIPIDSRPRSRAWTSSRPLCRWRRRRARAACASTDTTRATTPIWPLSPMRCAPNNIDQCAPDPPSPRTIAQQVEVLRTGHVR